MSLASMQTDTIVYWEPGAPDGFGKYSFATPVELKCRFQSSTERFVDSSGVEFISTAIVYPQQDLSLHGWIYKGTLASISSQADPQKVDLAYMIRAKLHSANPSGAIQVYKIILGG